MTKPIKIPASIKHPQPSDYVVWPQRADLNPGYVAAQSAYDEQIATQAPDRAAIEDALKAANGSAAAHTFTRAQEIMDLAEDAENRLSALNIPIKSRAGAEYHATSGTKLPNAYARTILRSHVRLIRRSGGWYLLGVGRVEDYPTASPAAYLHLTDEQDAIAVAKFRAGYTVLPAHRAEAGA